MDSREKVIAYVKHHLINCNVQGHMLSNADASDLVNDLDVECDEWSQDDRIEWWTQEEQRVEKVAVLLE